MYNIPHFKAADQKEVTEFMLRYRFAVLVGHPTMGYPVATHIPLLLQQRNDQLFLLGHIMKNTDHHRALASNNKVLVIFNGPHAHISASWYQNPHQASTWNYMTVHAKGTLAFLGDEELLDVLEKTTAYFENDPSSPAQVSGMPKEYVQKLMKAIIAFRIEVTSLDHVFKLSQNRDAETYQTIIDRLMQKDAQSKAVAFEMRTRAAVKHNPA